MLSLIFATIQTTQIYSPSSILLRQLSSLSRKSRTHDSFPFPDFISARNEFKAVYCATGGGCSSCSSPAAFNLL